MKVVAIIQARMSSTRLPGKVMLNLAGEPMLVRDVNRLQRARTIDEVVVATSIHPADNSIQNLCDQQDWPFYRGSEEDLLDRYYQTASIHKADVVVRITSDCPLIEPNVIDWVVSEFKEKQPVDYASNVIPIRTFPRGLDVEVMAFGVLEKAWYEDDNPAWREHVTPYIYSHPEKFKIHNVVNSIDYSSMRWTVDTSEDLAFVRCIYDYFGHDLFNWHEVIGVLNQFPEWLRINSHIKQKVV